MNLKIECITLQKQNLRVVRAGFWTHVLDISTGEGRWTWNGKSTDTHSQSTPDTQILHKTKNSHMNGLG